MKQIELYPELADYIFNYCGKYFSDTEIKAYKHLEAVKRVSYLSSFSSIKLAEFVGHKVEHYREDISTDEDVLNLVQDGFDAYKQRVATRIYAEHKDELELNLCPKCGKVARTPWAKQCRFCSHAWRENVQ